MFVKRLRDIEHQMFRLQKLCLYSIGKKTKFLRKIIARAGRTEVRQAKKFMSMYLFKNTPSL